MDKMAEVDETRKKIIRAAAKMNREDLIDLGRIIFNSEFKSKIKENTDGCRIDLGQLDNDIIKQLYGIVQHKTGKTSK